MFFRHNYFKFGLGARIECLKFLNNVLDCMCLQIFCLWYTISFANQLSGRISGG